MASFNAPKKSEVDRVHGSSLTSMESTEDSVRFRNRAGEEASEWIRLKNNAARSTSLVTLVSYDFPFNRDVVVKDWHDPYRSSREVTTVSVGYEPLRALAWSKCGRYLAVKTQVTESGDDLSKIHLFKKDLTTHNFFHMGSYIAPFQTGNPIGFRSLVWSPSARFLSDITMSEPTVWLRTGDTLTLIPWTGLAFRGEDAEWVSGPIDSQEQMLSVAAGESGEGEHYVEYVRIREAVYDKDTGLYLTGGTYSTPLAYSEKPYFISISPDKKYIAAVSETTGRLTILDFLKSSGTYQIVPINQPSITSTTVQPVWSPDGKYLAIASKSAIFPQATDISLYRRTASGFELLNVPALKDPTGETPYTDLCWTPDGKYLIGIKSHESSSEVRMTYFTIINDEVVPIVNRAVISGEFLHAPNASDMSPDGKYLTVRTTGSIGPTNIISPQLPTSGIAVRI